MRTAKDFVGIDGAPVYQAYPGLGYDLLTSNGLLVDREFIPGFDTPENAWSAYATVFDEWAKKNHARYPDGIGFSQGKLVGHGVIWRVRPELSQRSDKRRKDQFLIYSRVAFGDVAKADEYRKQILSEKST